MVLRSVIAAHSNRKNRRRPMFRNSGSGRRSNIRTDLARADSAAGRGAGTGADRSAARTDRSAGIRRRKTDTAAETRQADQTGCADCATETSRRTAGPMSMSSAKAVAVSAPRPEYPYEARRSKITGSGVCVMTVDTVERIGHERGHGAEHGQSDLGQRRDQRFPHDGDSNREPFRKCERRSRSP